MKAFVFSGSHGACRAVKTMPDGTASARTVIFPGDGAAAVPVPVPPDGRSGQ